MVGLKYNTEQVKANKQTRRQFYVLCNAVEVKSYTVEQIGTTFRTHLKRAVFFTIHGSTNI